MRRVGTVDDAPVGVAYDRLLAAIGERAAEVGDRPVVTHWPHVGSAYHGLAIVGQALHGQQDDFPAAQLRTPDGRAEVLCQTRRRNADRADPLDWIESHPVRNSLFWRVVRSVAEGIESEIEAPWYARLAWVNLYPAAPESPPCNPSGPLREAQDPLVGDLLLATVEFLDAHPILALVGPYWWPAGSSFFSVLEERETDSCSGPVGSMAGRGSPAGTPVAPAGGAGGRPPMRTCSSARASPSLRADLLGPPPGDR